MVIGCRVVAHAWKSTEVIERLGKVLLPLLDSLKEGPQKNRKFVRCYCQGRIPAPVQLRHPWKMGRVREKKWWRKKEKWRERRRN
jgi:hypothetical protein